VHLAMLEPRVLWEMHLRAKPVAPETLEALEALDQGGHTRTD